METLLVFGTITLLNRCGTKSLLVEASSLSVSTMPPQYQIKHLRSRMCFKLWLRLPKGSAFCHGMASSTGRYICVNLVPYKSRNEKRCIYPSAGTEWRSWQSSSLFIRLGMLKFVTIGVSDSLFLSMFLAYIAPFGYP